MSSSNVDKSDDTSDSSSSSSLLETKGGGSDESDISLAGCLCIWLDGSGYYGKREGRPGEDAWEPKHTGYLPLLSFATGMAIASSIPSLPYSIYRASE